MNQRALELVQRIENRTARVGIVGLGYAGLPLAVELAHVGFRVTGIDINQRRVAALMSGHSDIPDVPSTEIAHLVEGGFFQATDDYSVLRELDTVSICVPTPLSKTKDPDISYIVAVTDQLKTYMPQGMLVVLESTTYPGTTREVILHALSHHGTVGEDFFLAFSPERVDPGNKTFHTRNTPKIVGGITPTCTEVAAALYGQAVDTIVKVSSAEAAEMAKLLENTFRAVNIGLVNEVAIMCNHLGIDTWEVIDAAATKPFGFMKFYPGPGLGGHCIPVDPHYLSWKLRTLNYTARFIELAGEINSHMPEYVVGKVTTALNSRRKSVNGSRIAVIGIAYKKDVNDVRESPALDIINLLKERGAAVVYHDPFVPCVRAGDSELQSSSLSEALADCDCAVIATDHTDTDYRLVYDLAPAIVDTRNAFHGHADSAGKITKL